MVEKPIGITVVSVLFAINGLSLLLSSFRFFVIFIGSFSSLYNIVLWGFSNIFAFAMFMIGIFSLLEAWGIWNLKSWARTTGIILAVLILPVSGIISIGVLYFLLVHKETKQIFN